MSQGKREIPPWVSNISMVTYRQSAYGVPPGYEGKLVNITEVGAGGVTKLLILHRGKKIIEWPMSAEPGGWFFREPQPKKRPRRSPLWDTKVQQRELSYYDQFLNPPPRTHYTPSANGQGGV